MIIMLFFMFKYSNHMTAPQITMGLSVENLIMFLLATPVQVRNRTFSSNSIDSLVTCLIDCQWSLLLHSSLQSIET